jgi:vancomycin resistance protein YoaR
MAEGTGGGTCQVASTLYAAALLSGLEIVSRAPHTRPSAYIRMGLDATVAFPAIDLRLQNPLAVPVTIRATTRGVHGALTVSFEARGADKPEVSVTSEIVERLPFVRTIRADRSLAEGEARLVAFGIPGYRVRRVRELRRKDGVFHRDVRVDLYPPTNEVVAVPPGYDGARLEQERPAIDPAAVRPVLVQLRPSTEVRLDNVTSERP